MEYLRILKPNLGISYTRAFAKGIFLICVGKAFLAYEPLNFFQDTPQYIERMADKHPINPPIYAPHPFEEPNEREKYDELVDNIIQISTDNTDYYMYKKIRHPSLEDGFIIKEALWESDSERIFDEIRGEVKRQLRQNENLELQNSFHIIQRKVLFEKLKSNIKPAQ